MDGLTSLSHPSTVRLFRSQPVARSRKGWRPAPCVLCSTSVPMYSRAWGQHGGVAPTLSVDGPDENTPDIPRPSARCCVAPSRPYLARMPFPEDASSPLWPTPFQGENLGVSGNPVQHACSLNQCPGRSALLPWGLGADERAFGRKQTAGYIRGTLIVESSLGYFYLVEIRM